MVIWCAQLEAFLPFICPMEIIQKNGIESIRSINQISLCSTFVAEKNGAGDSSIEKY